MFYCGEIQETSIDMGKFGFLEAKMTDYECAHKKCCAGPITQAAVSGEVLKCETVSFIGLLRKFELDEINRLS